MFSNFSFDHLSKSELKKRYFLFSFLKNKKVIYFLSFLGIWGLRLRLPFVKHLVKKYLFDVFIGGETLLDCVPGTEKLRDKKVLTILDYGVEASRKEKKFQSNHQQLIQKILFAREHQVDFIAVKITAIGDVKLLQLLSEEKILNEAQKAAYHKIITRLNTISKLAADNKVKVLIDAEESWIQNEIDRLCFRMMKIYNIKEAVIYNTIQLYRNDKLRFLRQEILNAREHKIFYGLKLVRGAYVEKENKRALKLNYASPIHVTKEATDKDFNAGLSSCFDNLDVVRLMVATHNEASVLLTLKFMQEQKMKPNDDKISLSQLLGMADKLTFTLAKKGYRVAKYFPYGNIIELLPYLVRRLGENTSMQGQVEEELLLLKKALQKK